MAAQLDQLKSEPLELMIAGSVPAPIVTSNHAQVTSVPQDTPRPAQPGDIATVDGSNFSQSDEVEIIDSQGVVHRVPVGSTSSPSSTCFTVPENIADGDATFEIVEQRSGLRQRSKKISMRILNVPLPLEIRPSDTRPVAPGQWIDIGFESVPPYDRAARVEVAFEQNEHTEVIELQLEPNDDLHVRVPQTLLPGEVLVRTRTFRDGRASEWSQAARLELLEQPAPPFVESVQRRRIKDQQSEPLLHLENDRSSALIAAPGDWIAIWGNFAAESTSTLRVILVNGGRKVVIKPSQSDRAYATYFEVQLPRDLRVGEWEVHISEEVHNTSAKLKLTLQVH